jgi:hypothetical protein
VEIQFLTIFVSLAAFCSKLSSLPSVRAGRPERLTALGIDQTVPVETQFLTNLRFLGCLLFKLSSLPSVKIGG